jgi:hypothetical protein
MFCEYGVEPKAIGSNWQTFLYLIEKFGFDRGRLIAQFPREWFEEVLREAARVRPADKLRMIEKLNEAKRTKVIKSSRAYDRSAGDWLYNAFKQHAILPFHAIIATQNPNASQGVLLVEDLDEQHPLMADQPVARSSRHWLSPSDLACRDAFERSLRGKTPRQKTKHLN